MTKSYESGGCCTPDRTELSDVTSVAAKARVDASQPGSDVDAHFIELTGGTFLMGANDPAAHPADGEGPVRAIKLSPFRIDAVAVSNARFKRFIDATGHQTDAERFGWSFVFAGFLRDNGAGLPAIAAAPWWRQVHGASWRAPEGQCSTIEDRLDHPVTHVSHSDAEAYCAWADARLPTEAEWEFSARGGLVQKRYPWGDNLMVEGEHACNIWQGRFPDHNSAEDGFAGTAPVDAFATNAFGLYNVVGNAWEWCADWFHPSHHTKASFEDPKGPPTGTAKVMRGGSYMCHASYCHRYRVSARSSATTDTSLGHTGFRIARDM